MPGTPKVNQDYGFVMYPVVPCGTDSTFRVGTLIAGIFDGHGKGGESISRIAALKVGRSLELSMADTPSKPLGVRIAQLRFEKAFEFAEACVKELLPADVYACAGTTGTAIVIHDDDDGVRRMAVGHVGDSRLIRGSVQPDGTEGWIVTARTRDHKPSDPEERARIEKAGGLAVARAIGDGEMKTVGVSAVPSTMCIPLREEDKVLVIASDGLWEHLSDEEVLAFCYRYRADASLAAKALVLEAARAWYEKGTYRDDITVCVFFLPFEGSPAVVGLPPPPPISSVLPEHYVQFGIEWPQRNTTRSSSSDDAEFPTPRAPTPRA
ncbi:protein phosphatase 2c [Chrysochromulina tobinii]|uniref:Protein phosphatase 2c n=1 Tax=Chrysochromulina tobinii TaxID=1460289 RepID=A0A0M0J3F3_9EUKA|nr:protein phosphatase 2c [Chrysochromulina tobinii]|eukprot:KOO21086.1 protein phosphatase 2c [Chrysochromulina sp. CCMP291]